MFSLNNNHDQEKLAQTLFEHQTIILCLMDSRE